MHNAEGATVIVLGRVRNNDSRHKEEIFISII